MTDTSARVPADFHGAPPPGGGEVRGGVEALFVAQAARTPDAMAVTCSNDALTYAQLDRRTNQLAAHLQSCGVGPDVLVGLCVERSLDMLVGVLGILKAGGAYVPMDPAYPKARLGHMLTDAGASVLLTQARLRPLLPESAARVICIDADWPEIARQPETPPPNRATRDNAQYVIYTSGSTGTPKGSLVYRRGFSNLVDWYRNTIACGPDTRVLLMSSLSFDLTQKNIFMPLAWGGCLHLLESQVYDAPLILAALERHAITVVNCTPSAFLGLLNHADAAVYERLASLRWVFLGGEPIPVVRLRAWMDSGRCSARIVNSYGPTECADVCAFHVLGDLEQYETRSVPIGKPLPHTLLHILDADLNPVANGVEGELCIAGVGVGGGYLHNPELTAQRFVSTPLVPPGARLYRTGDRARMRPDGDIEFLGRIDTQIKIRGFRVELGEIQAILGQQDDVCDAACVARRDQEGGEPRIVAYIVRHPGRQPTVSALRSALQKRLPDYMLPTAWVFIDKLPLTTNGKLDTAALPAPGNQRPELSVDFVPPRTKLEQFLAAMWRELLGLDRVGTADTFFELGGNSIKAIQFVADLGHALGAPVPIVALFEHPTIVGVADYVKSRHATAVAVKFGTDAASLPHAPAPSRARGPASQALAGAREDIAVIGITGRLPGAPDVDAFWQNLRDGVCSIVPVTADDLRASQLDPALLQDPGYIAYCASMDDVENFDAAFFGCTPREAELMDPQHRAFLECAWSALESAGYTPESAGRVGVFGGVARNSYLLHNLASHQSLRESAGDYQLLMPNEKDFPSTRVSFKLNLHGPAVNVQTACSSTGVALHLARQSLLSGDCDVALVGGCRVMSPARAGYSYVEGGTLSADGRVHAFDARASGMVRGSGVVFLVLKRLRDACADGDCIRALVKGSAINNDGSAKAGFTAPSVEGQAEVVRRALADAGVAADTISYVEAHGTGTALGDPIEVAALQKTYRETTDKTGYCGLGSVKTNIGHLDAGACAAGMLKTILALEHRALPPSLHFETPNPNIDFANSPFYVNTKLRDWPGGANPRRAGVSSFGLGGTNAHVILQEAPAPSPAEPARPWQLLLLSARSAAALDAATQNLRAYLAAHTDSNLADVAYTLQTGRRAFAHRRAIVCRSVADALQYLDALPPAASLTRTAPAYMPDVALMFPGQGTQYAGMGIKLYAHEPVFREALDSCAALLRVQTGADLLSALQAQGPEATKRLSETALAQPAIFSVSYALVKLWQHWGIQPTAMIGHSVGEFVCACLSGVFSLEDALRLVASRGRMMQDLPRGSMLSIRLPAEKVQPRLSSDSAIAAINGPSLCVASGPTESMARLQESLAAEGVVCKPLPTSHAFHSPMVDPMVAPFTELVRSCKLAPPTIPFVSTVTATWITAEQATDPTYWGRHARMPVRFAEGVKVLWELPERVLLEAGPGTTAATLARQQSGAGSGRLAISSMGRGGDDVPEWDALLLALGELWMAGVPIDWSHVHGGGQRRRVPLPTYPFERKRYWVEPAAAGKSVAPAPAEGAAATAAPSATAAPPAELVVEAAGSRVARLTQRVMAIVTDLTGTDVSGMDPALSFLELGLDSLALTQMNQMLRKEFGVAITLRMLLTDLTSPQTLVAHLETAMPADVLRAPSSVPLNQVASAPTAQAADASAATAEPPKKVFGAGARISKEKGAALTPPQQAALDALIKAYTTRTAGSKRFTVGARAQLADPRAVSGFRLPIKEIVYPIVVERSEGCRLWDIDGNAYIDVTSGFGSNFFGHRAPFVVKAVHDQLDHGYEIGPQHPLAASCASLMCELTGMDRAAFCNTGSEAVLGALRIARTVTGRQTVVMFTGAYHGILDEVIVRGSRSLKSVPAAPGIPRSAVENMLVLDYGTDETLRIIEARAGELAAVLVEPVQSRCPDLQPREFLHRIRAITAAAGAALIFDEIVTGFRIHQGGAQAHFGIQADIATYGKVVGGGMPVGVITGKREYMDALDGGPWSFGDESLPEVGVTYFAGTFVRHPLTLAAIHAALTYLKTQGPQLQDSLNALSDAFAADLNAVFQARGVPLHMANFGSLLRLHGTEDLASGDLLYARLRLAGVYIWDHRPCYLTISHTKEDLDAVVKEFDAAIVDLQAGGLLPAPSADARPSALRPPLAIARLGRDPLGNPAWYVPDPERTGRSCIVKPASTPGTVTTAPVDYDPVARGALSAVVPSTHAQKEIWLSVRMGGPEANLAFNESVTVRAQGSLDAAALHTAVQAVMERHEALRASFSPDGAWMCMAATMPMEVPVEDLAPLAPAARAQRLQAILDEEVEIPFDVEHGPLVRFRLLRLGPAESMLAITAHHVCCDGWAIDVLVRDLGALYLGALRGQPVTLGPPDRFSDYAREAEDNIVSGKDAADEQYWLERFQGPLPVLELPLPGVRPPRRTFRGGRVDVTIDPALIAALRQTGVRLGCSLVNVLLAAFKAWICRMTGQTDLVVGLPAAGQSATGRPDLVGHCVNLLPLRSVIDPARPFSECARTVRGVLLDAHDHQGVTFGRLLERLRVPRDPSRIPLLPVAFNIDQGIAMEGFNFGDFPTAFRTNPRHYENFELFLNASPEGETLVFQANHNADLMDSATVQRWMLSLVELLKGVARDPEVAVGDLPVMTDSDRQQLLTIWNNTPAPLPPAAGIAALFEAQVAQQPTATALVVVPDVDGRAAPVAIPYAALNGQANRLARDLQARGLRAGDVVALCVERSADLVVGMLAILKAGGVYLPLDPTWPRERMAFMLGDSGARLLLADAASEPALPVFEGPRVRVASGAGDQAAASDSNLGASPGGDAPAYIMYTSGSTGTPKGALIPHRGVVRLVRGATFMTLDRDTVMLQAAPAAFDAATLEIWGPLLNGGHVVIAPPGTLTTVELGRIIRTQGVNALWLSAELFRLMVDERLDDLAGVKQLLAGGDVLPVPQVRRVLETHPACQLINGYGPTENTTFTCCHAIRADARWENAVPIGRPIGNTTVYVLDARLQPVPIGIAGELCTGGSGLALRYVNRPDLTSERFVRDPFAEEPGARLYRTGDLVRFRDDGVIEFLGRVDRQLKLRGFRVEPGEIEAALETHDDVARTAVIAREDQPGDVVLAAYLVPREGGAGALPTATELRRFLRKTLPDFMIPQFFVELPQLPMTPTGKVDRAALPSPRRGGGAREVLAPRTPAEQRVVAVWRDVLKVESIGVRDNFFDLGGHSLLAIEVVSRLNAEAGARLSPRLLLFHTVEQLATMLDGKPAAG